MTLNNHTEDAQRKLVFGKRPTIDLVQPCKIGEGILMHSKDERQNFIQLFQAFGKPMEWFVPASGSGSRMFQFLYDFLENPDDENRGKVERFLNHLNDFAFSRNIDASIKNRLNTNQINLDEFVQYVVQGEGLNYGQLPKGLIPFHQYAYFIVNPFQEQLLQAALLNKGLANVHFTINKEFTEEIAASVEKAREMSGFQFNCTFSTQDASTDSLAFYEDQSVVVQSNGMKLTRPSGHGALLNNLNTLNAELIFIKNIDNIQHQNFSNQSEQEIQYIAGVLLHFKQTLQQLYQQESIDREQLKQQLNRYQLCWDMDELIALPESDLKEWLNRPIRVCGMVKNEGQAGGGPFWVRQNGVVSKQIVEKSQVNLSSEQYNIMLKSSHFNPVMMACHTKDLNGEKFVLEDFCDNSSYFIVNKKFKGKSVLFLENPGLWNGGMAKWHTLFVEISSSSFSPVKIVLDLLDFAHKV
jgi:hypothetical protein